MIVKTEIKLTAKDVLLMHNNTHLFRAHVYTFMQQFGCSRTIDELDCISADELVKDMWYLSISPDTHIYVTEIDYELLHDMLNSVNASSDVCEVRLESLFHEYIAVMMATGEWVGL